MTIERSEPEQHPSFVVARANRISSSPPDRPGVDSSQETIEVTHEERT